MTRIPATPAAAPAAPPEPAPPEPAPASPSPVRLLNVDALRGFALLGILTVNIWAFADPYYAATAGNPTYDSALDHIVRFLVSLFFETKFYLLFSFLFGYSFTLQMAAAERAGASFRPRMLRRQAGLLTIGLLHGALLFHGEILTLYAVLGLVLLACRGLAPRRAARTAVVLLGVSGGLWLLLGLADLTDGGASPGPGSGPADKLAAFTGDAAATAGYHAGHLAETIGALVLLQGASSLAMFLLGLAAGRVRLFADPDAHRALFRRILRTGLPLGLAGAAFYAWCAVYRQGSALETLAFAVGQLTAPLLTAGYVILGLALFRTARGAAVERALAPLGKTALSAYLLQSLTLGVLFTGYGFGLIDRLAPLAVVAIVPAVFLAQLLLAKWWLRGHRYGPGEWLLRAATVAGIPKWREREGKRRAG
ncbi:DUF418 domain-containing protein [Streptomyces qinzhouensis]|uniref:DUF418 domain-containing protein n=1 Tax=Streptomyces qinzhouensis TaxID=2599401 RepID=A0A5B8II26_9ACTN|nr:DUF418 domain-containing protein [Streptomyces qinzhouensis]QDY77972.1 DUF418 domain-containing protein [Streptomyces qinzhouensis]